MSKYSAKEDKDCYIVHHPDGTSFRIAKKGLGKHTVQKIQKFDDGGVVKPAEERSIGADLLNSLGAVQPAHDGNPGLEADPLTVNPVDPAGQKPPIFGQVSGILQGAAANPPPELASEEILDPAVPAPGRTPAGTNQTAAQSLMEKGINETYQAEKMLNDGTIKAQADLRNDLQKTQDRIAETKKAYDIASDNQIKLMTDGKIDPKRVWHSMSTGEQIATGIALFLGGLGGGLQGTGRNSVAEFFQKRIEQDIEAQKANLEQKNTVFSAQLKKYGNTIDAETATRKILVESTVASLEIAKSKAGTQAAKGRADMALGALRREVEMGNQSLAMKQAAGPVGSAIQSLPQPLQAKAWEEKGIVDQMKSADEQITALLMKANEANRLGKGGSIPGTSASKILAQAEAQVRSLLQANWKGPMTDEEAAKLVGPYLSSVTDNAKDVARKTKGLLEMIKRNAKPTPILDSYGLSGKKTPFTPKTQLPR